MRKELEQAQHSSTEIAQEHQQLKIDAQSLANEHNQSKLDAQNLERENLRLKAEAQVSGPRGGNLCELATTGPRPSGPITTIGPVFGRVKTRA